jgi:hypothetical protein
MGTFWAWALFRFILIATAFSPHRSVWFHVLIVSWNNWGIVRDALMTRQQYKGYCTRAPCDNGPHTLTTS